MTEPPNVDILDLEIDEGSPDMNEVVSRFGRIISAIRAIYFITEADKRNTTLGK